MCVCVCFVCVTKFHKGKGNSKKKGRKIQPNCLPVPTPSTTTLTVKVRSRTFRQTETPVHPHPELLVTSQVRRSTPFTPVQLGPPLPPSLCCINLKLSPVPLWTIRVATVLQVKVTQITLTFNNWNRSDNGMDRRGCTQYYLIWLTDYFEKGRDYKTRMLVEIPTVSFSFVVKGLERLWWIVTMS